MALICLLGGGLIFLAPSLQVLGVEWAPSVPVARWLGLYVCLRSGAHLIHALLAATGRPGVDASLRGAWVVLLALSIAAVARHGIIAVAAVQAVVAGVLLLGYVVAAVRFVSIRGRRLALDLGRQAIVTAIAGSVVAGLRLFGGVWTADTTWATLFLLSSAFVVVYAAGTMLLVPGVGQDLRRLRARLA
jgi:hypothetical protein